MPILKLAGREYPMPDFDTLTFEEGSMIKKATGLRMGELSEAFSAGDTDAIMAIILIAKLRSDGAVDIDAVKASSISEVEVVADEEEAEEEDAPLVEEVKEEVKAEPKAGSVASKNKA